MGKKRKKAWQASPLCLFWIVWKEMNSRAFHGNGHAIQRLRQSFRYNLWGWVNMFIVPKAVSFVDVVNLLGTP